MNDKAIRIKKWEDLDKQENDTYSIIWGEIDIIIRLKNGWDQCIKIRPHNTPQDTVLSILRQFGFEVEFVKPVELTEADKLWVKAALASGYHYAVRDNGNQYTDIYKYKPISSGKYYYPDHKFGDEEVIGLPDHILMCVKTEQPLFLDDLGV